MKVVYNIFQLYINIKINTRLIYFYNIYFSGWRKVFLTSTILIYKYARKYNLIFIDCNESVSLPSTLSPYLTKISSNYVLSVHYNLLYIKMNPFFPWSRQHAWMAGPISLIFLVFDSLVIEECNASLNIIALRLKEVEYR